jgi:hypothetical protein
MSMQPHRVVHLAGGVWVPGCDQWRLSAALPVCALGLKVMCALWRPFHGLEAALHPTMCMMPGIQFGVMTAMTLQLWGVVRGRVKTLSG